MNQDIMDLQILNNKYKIFNKCTNKERIIIKPAQMGFIIDFNQRNSYFDIVYSIP